MNKMKKVVGLGLSLMLMLSACGSTQEQPGDQAADKAVSADSDAKAQGQQTSDAPVKLSILTTRQTTATNDVEDVWFFKFLSKKMNLDLELEQTLEPEERISLMFASDSVPDIVWGIGLSNSDVMLYGSEEGMLLDWTDLMTEELMPNLCKAREDYPDAFAASMTPDGKTYALPCITGSSYYANTGSFSCTVRTYINKKWLDACGLEMPNTLDEYLNVLRTFKKEDPMGLGANNIPLIGNQNKDKEFVWNSLGFIGTATQCYGTEFAIRNNEVVLPCYTEYAKEFVDFYHTLYTEGLISADYFTFDQTTARGLMASGYAGVIGDSTLNAIGDAYADWYALPLITSDVNDKTIASIRPAYSTGMLYCSSRTEHPEVIAKIVDYLYSDEGALNYYFGPMRGTEDTDDVVTGWYLDDDNELTYDLVQSGEYAATSEYAYQFIKPTLDVAGRFDHYGSQIKKTAGVEDNTKYLTIDDQLTGKKVDSVAMVNYTDDNNDGHWRLTQSDTMVDHLTEVRLPAVYLSSDDNKRVADLSTVINDYVTKEIPKFIVGERSMDEYDAYMEELKSLGIEEYIEIYKNAYAPYMETLK